MYERTALRPTWRKHTSTLRIRFVNPMCDQRIPASIVLTCTDHHPSAPATARTTHSIAAGQATTPEEPLSRLTVIKAVLGPILRLMFRPQVEGVENIPGTGPVILAGNHLTFIDSMIMPICCDRPVFYIGKDEYVTGKGLKGKLMAWFFTGCGMIPVDRDGGRGGVAALMTGRRVLEEGQAFAIYPEGTRSPTAGSTGAVRASRG